MFENHMGVNPYRIGMPQFSTGINWVEGMQDVDRVELPPGGMAVFLDKENDGIMYLKTRDVYNVYSTRVFNYTEIHPKQPESPYVTRNELEEMFQRFLGGGQNVTVQPVNGTETATTAELIADPASQPTGGGKRKANG